MIDNYKHKGKRRQLVNTLIGKGITDENVLKAINNIPRHYFMDSAFEDHAYEDKAFPIEANQTISHPFTVAYQTQLLDISINDKVLEVGTGSGYQTAVLVKMGAKVYTIERQKKLVSFSKKMFNKLRLSPHYQTFGDGYLGLPTFAPFDKIIVTAGSPIIPKDLLKQLKVGGKAVIPIGETNQKMYLFKRITETEFKKMEFGDYKFVPMLIAKDI